MTDHMTYWACSVVSVVFSVGLVVFYRARRFLRGSYTSILALVVFSISSTYLYEMKIVIGNLFESITCYGTRILKFQFCRTYILFKFLSKCPVMPQVFLIERKIAKYLDFNFRQSSILLLALGHKSR